MPAARHDIEIEQRATFSLVLTVQDAGVPRDLSASELRAALYRRGGTVAEESFGPLTGLTVTNAAGGEATWVISPAITTTLAGEYDYDLVVETGGVVQRLLQGVARVSPGVA